MQEICKNLSSNANIIDVKRISNNIYEKRKKILPAVPKDLTGVYEALEDMKPVTKEGEPFLLFNDIEKHMIIFSCNKNLKLLSEIVFNSIIYMNVVHLNFVLGFLLKCLSSTYLKMDIIFLLYFAYY